jgi:hypothetical protein
MRESLTYKATLAHGESIGLVIRLVYLTWAVTKANA